MPYLSAARRVVAVKHMHEGNLDMLVGGDLNYIITTACLGFVGAAPSYARFNEAIGALECAKLELYRRMVAPYEDRKANENGDVYP